MTDLPAVRWLLRLLLNPGWDPLAVVGLHLVLAGYGLTQRLDHLLHFLGGASIAYFFLANHPWERWRPAGELVTEIKN